MIELTIPLKIRACFKRLFIDGDQVRLACKNIYNPIVIIQI